MNNIEYFNYSQINNDDIINLSKPEGLLIQKDEIEITNNLIDANHSLHEMIITYKKLKELNLLNTDLSIKLLDNIINLIENVKMINYTSFCTYFQVIGYSYNAYMIEKDKKDIIEKREIITKILDLYIENRYHKYITFSEVDNLLQIGSDLSSNRKKSKTGIEKMENVILDLNFTKVDSLESFENTDLCYILPDKGDINLFNLILNKNLIKFKFREDHDNKAPDMLLKISNDYFIIEHKLTNGSGGSQNAEINEIIQFINQKEDFDNWHYVSCLQGNYFKKFNENNSEPKSKQQFINIKNYLNNIKNNYFINGKGFELLVENYLEDLLGD